MKKLILVFGAITIAMCAYTQTDSTNKKMSPPAINNYNDGLNQNQNDMNNSQSRLVENNSVNNSHPDGVMMQNGKIMQVRDGKTTLLDKEMTMSNGTKIMSDGTYIKKDGSKMKLKEGQHIDMSGNLITTKTNSDKNKNTYPVSDSTRKNNQK